MSEQPDPLVSRHDLVEIRAEFRRRWWIVPSCWLLVTGLLFAQEVAGSDRTPSFTLAHRYETGNPSDVVGDSLIAIGLDGFAFHPSVGLRPVIEQFNADAQITERRETTGLDTIVTAELGPREHRLVGQSLVEASVVYSILGLGGSVVTLTCREPSNSSCRKSIELAEVEFRTRRTAAVRTAAENIVRALSLRLEAIRRIEQERPSSEATTLRIELESQITVVRQIVDELELPLFFLSEESNVVEPESNLTWSTPILGVILGSVLAALILVQLGLRRAGRRRIDHQT